jgi:hypothetical protein
LRPILRDEITGLYDEGATQWALGLQTEMNRLQDTLNAGARMNEENTNQWITVTEEFVANPPFGGARIRIPEINPNYTVSYAGPGIVDGNPPDISMTWDGTIETPPRDRTFDAAIAPEYLTHSQLRNTPPFYDVYWFDYPWNDLLNRFEVRSIEGESHNIGLSRETVGSIFNECSFPDHSLSIGANSGNMYVFRIIGGNQTLLLEDLRNFCEDFPFRYLFQVVEYFSGPSMAKDIFSTVLETVFGQPQAQRATPQTRFKDKESLLKYIRSKVGNQNHLHWLNSDSHIRNGFSETTRINISYLSNLQNQSGEDMTLWNIVEMFFSDSAQMEQSRGEINQVFFAPRTPNDFLDFTKVEVKSDVVDLKESLKEMSANSFVLLKEQAKNLAAGKELAVNAAYDTYMKVYKEFCVSQRVSAYLQAPRSDRPEKLKSQVEKIVSSGLFKFEGVQNQNLVFSTLQEVVCKVHERDLHWEVSSDFRRIVSKYVRNAQNVYTINYGFRTIKVDMNNFDCRVEDPLPFEQSPYDHYTHHYSPRNDRFCVGLEVNKVKEMFKANDIANLLRLLYDLMTTYNREGNPHRRIDWAIAIEAQKTIVAKLLPVFLENWDDVEEKFTSFDFTNDERALWEDYLWLVRNANMGICYSFHGRRWENITYWVNPLDDNDRGESERDDDDIQEDEEPRDED